MRISHEHSKQEVTVSVNVEDGPTVPRPYAARPRDFRLEYVRASFVWRENTRSWETDFFSLRVCGPELKQDGTDSRNEYNDRPPNNYETDPKWADVVRVVQAIRPEGPPPGVPIATAPQSL